ncbi:hypothetical protein ACHAW5_000826 [Stephanodiscus triporus]|uniref:Uncharacterized protein n=1 Tax=Stephanodiscus triporus TaxID=2934178 RepID=A0ABD3QKE4_9STRA
MPRKPQTRHHACNGNAALVAAKGYIGRFASSRTSWHQQKSFSNPLNTRTFVHPILPDWSVTFPLSQTRVAIHKRESPLPMASKLQETNNMSRMTHSRKADVEMSKNPRSARDPEAHMFDQFLKKLETTKQHKQKTTSQNDAVDSSDGSTCDSRNDGHFDDNGSRHDDQHQGSESRLFETRQLFVDRQLVGPMSSVDSFIEKQKSDWQPDPIGQVDSDDVLPSALLKAFTVDKRDLMIRPGVRCTGESLPQGVTTIGMDCIGRVVQLTNHARAVYGISIDDRIAAIYPFDYNIDKFRTNTKFSYALVDAGFVVAVPKHVDAAEAACIIRLYLSAFQSILKGIAGVCKDRYGKDQLTGQSILVQNGHTDLVGR